VWKWCYLHFNAFIRSHAALTLTEPHYLECVAEEMF